MERQIESLFIAGDLSAAQEAADRAAQNFKSHAPWSARFLVDRARIRLYRGLNQEAANLLKPNLSQTPTPDIALQRSLLLAMACSRIGDLQCSAQALADADGLHPQGVAASELLGAHGSIALDRGQFLKAEPFFRDALLLAESGSAQFQQTQMLMNLGVVALQQQHYEDALERFHRASTIAQSIQAKLTLQYALGNLGFVSYQTGDFLSARDASRQAAIEAGKMGLARSQAAWLRNTGMSYFRLNDLANARALCESSLALSQQIKNPDGIFDAHQALGYLLLQTDPALAGIHIHEATRLAQKSARQPDILEQQFAEALLFKRQDQRLKAIALLRSFHAQPGSLPSLYWESEITLAKLYEQARDRHQAEFWFRRALDTFHRQRLSIHTVDLALPFLGNGNDLYFAYVDYLIRQHRPADALELLDRDRAETLVDSLGIRAVTAPLKKSAATLNASALAKRLNATILVYSLRPGVSYLWSITPTREDFHTLLGTETILPLIRRHNQAILASDDLLTQKQSTGRALYDALIQPAFPDLPKPGSRVILIADEELNDLSFETLIPPTGPPHYWIEDVTVTNARSLRLLQASSTPQPIVARRNALLIGDPVYRDTGYPELPNAATELGEISRHFSPAERIVLQGPQAVPGAYAASMPGAYAYIHFVAHATANETSPLDSAIVLSKPALQPFAYRLYARDILNQRIHANLVTIAACYGSGRRNYSGEGLVGLAWAFLHAGAHHVIGALWQVSDASTPLLMDRLYTGLLAGLPPDTALREAKLATLHAGGAFRKPLYWAPFQMYSGT